MEVRQKLEDFFHNYNHYITIEELSNKLNITLKEVPIFLDELFKLEMDGVIIGDNNGYARIPKEFYLIRGKVSVSSRNKHYVWIDNNTCVLIKRNDLNGANKDDVVFIEVLDQNLDHKSRVCGKVRRVVLPPKGMEKTFHCRGIIKSDFPREYYIDLENDKVKIYFRKLHGANIGDEVTVFVKNINNEYIGEVKEILKAKEKPCITKRKPSEKVTRFESVEWKSHEFPDEVLDEVREIPQFVTEENIKDRVDLRSLTTVTIDSEDSKDLDDAISVERLENGNFILYVHIADVSEYVRPGMHTFEEGCRRGVSTYLADYVIPMLPKRLSNGICSLNPNQDRLALTCKMIINSKGIVEDYDLFESVTHSDCKMAYKKLNNYIDSSKKVDEYKEFDELINNMKELYYILKKKREEKDENFISNQEYEIHTNEEGYVESIALHESGIANEIIENFMIIANETVATHGYWLNLPFVFRNHDFAKLDDLLEREKLSLKTKRLISKIQMIDDPRLLMKIVTTLKEYSEYQNIYNELVNPFNRANYSPKNMGHCGLRLEYYTHFTSPIRRFSDLLVHYFLKESLKERKKGDFYEQISSRLPDICIHLSIQSRNADQLERSINNAMILKYVKKFEGKIVEGIIEEIAEEKLEFHILGDVTGLIYHNKIGYYHYDQETNSIYDQYHNCTYRVGDRIQLKIKKVNKSGQGIIFELEEEAKKNKVKEIIKK